MAVAKSKLSGAPEDKDIVRAEQVFAPQRQKQQEYLTEDISFAQQQRDAEEAALTAKENRDISVKEAGAQALQESAIYKESLIGETKEKIEKNPFPSFKPTQEDLSSYAQLGSMIGTFGLILGAGGKQTSRMAINSMTGMLNGWQKGRKDLWDKEAKEFEKEIQRTKLLHDSIYKDLDLGLSAWSTNREAAKSHLENAAYKAGTGSVIASYINSGRAKDAREIAGKIYKLSSDIDSKIIDLAAKERQFRVAAAAESAKAMAIVQAAIIRAKSLVDVEAEKQAGRIRADMIKGQKPAADKKATGQYDYVVTKDGRTIAINKKDPNDIREIPTDLSGATRVGAQPKGVQSGGAVQFRYNSAVTNAANVLATELDNASSIPFAASIPGGGDVLTNPEKKLTDAIVKNLAGNLTSVEDRAFQQVKAGMQRAQVAIEAGGRPGGMNEAAFKQLNAQAAQGFDSKINYLLWLALAKQHMSFAIKDLEANGGTKEQIAQARVNTEKVEKLIPWSVKDILGIVGGGRASIADNQTIRLIQTSRNIEDFESKLEQGTQGGGGPKEGDTDKSKTGKPIIYKNGKWEYQ